jgi:Putative phage tail protein
LKFRNRRTIKEIAVSANDLVEVSATSAILSQTRAQETELPSTVRLGYVESALDYRSAAVQQQKLNIGSSREINITLPAVVGQSLAQARVDVALEESWASREKAQFTLSPQLTKIEAGDVLVINSDRWRVQSIADGIARRVEAVAHDPAVYDPPPFKGRLASSATSQVFGKPDVVMMDLATASNLTAPWIAAQATPWPGSLALYKKTGTSSFAFIQLLSQQATIATTLTIFPSGETDRIVGHFSLDILMHFGACASVSKDELLNGANLAAIGNAETGFEIVQFQTAELIAANTYRLSGFLRGQGGSEVEMLASRPAGQNFVLLNSAVPQLQLSLTESTLNNTWRIGPSSLDHGHPAYLEISFAGAMRALRPLRPTYLKATRDSQGIGLSWLRRTRVDGDSWDVAEVPLSEAAELYKLEILNGTTVVRSVLNTSQNYLYATADIITDFGAVQASLSIRISQMSAVYGPGTPLERTLNV